MRLVMQSAIRSTGALSVKEPPKTETTTVVQRKENSSGHCKTSTIV